jgi:hypothetical protein
VTDQHDEELADDVVSDRHGEDRSGDDQHDEQVDAELDAIDDGSDAIGSGATTPEVVRSEALPFVLTTREHFASVGDIEITGEARVDAATARLDEIADLPTPDHVAVYDDVHRRLQDALSDAEVR